MNKHFWLMALLSGSAAFAAEESATINRARVNVRGGPSLASEVITQLQKGDKVTVLEDIAIEKPKPGEPAKWAMIKLPANTPVWVFSDFLDGSKVKVKKLNLRAGPGENFSVLGSLAKGDAIKEIRTTEGWTEIEAPDSTRAYLDAAYLERETKVAAAPTPAPEPLKVYEPPAKPTVNPVANKPEPVAAEAPKVEAPKPEPIVVKTDPAPAKEEPKPEQVVLREETKPEPALAPVESKPVQATKETPAPKEEPKVAVPKVEEAKPAATPSKPEENTAQPAPRVLPQVAPAPDVGGTVVMSKRVVRREGEVHATKFNIQAPTYFDLRTAKGKTINYLSSEKSGLKLKDYKGLKVVVTGEESIEPRFPEVPILEIETIEVAP